MHILGRAMEKDFWKEVREDSRLLKYREMLLCDWEALMKGGPLLALKYSEWKLYFVTGDRSAYQKSFLKYRHALATSALLSLVYPDEEKYLAYLMDAIYTVCDAYTWSYPAHQGAEGNTVNNNTVIDLTASRVAMDLAAIYNLLGDRLEPLIKSRILAEIDRRIFTPFESKEPCAWWETCTSNWVAVCIGSIARAYMLLRPEKAIEYIPRFNRGMDNYITGFSEEGICFEGGGYWIFGFGAFVGYAKAVRAFTDGETDYFKIPKTKEMSLFYQRIFLSGSATANFADSEIMGVPGALSRILKSEFDEINVVPSIEGLSFGSVHEFSADIENLLSILTTDFQGDDAGDNYYSEFYAKSAEWYIKHTPKSGFAVKGGNNREHHNHNDVGHFIYAKGGEQILCDVGVGIYTADYFGAKRYERLEPSSKCHSVPIIDGEYQKFGYDFKARDFKYENGILSLDISQAYGILDADERIDRNFDILDEGFKMTDKITLNKKRGFVERLVTRIEPDLSKKGEVTIAGVPVRYDADRWECFLGGSEPSARDQKLCYYIDFKPIGKISDFVIKVDKYE